MSSILVTGSTGGIGAPLCTRLAKAGHQLVLVARDAERLASQQAALPGANHLTISLDMASDNAPGVLDRALTTANIELDGAVLMPPQPHAVNDPMPPSQVWRDLFQTSLIGPLAVLKAAIGHMLPDPSAGKRCKIVVISGISSAQVLSNYATSNVIRTAWIGQAKTLAFALGERGIHVNTLSLGGTLTPDYRTGIERRAAIDGISFAERLRSETDNVPLRKYGTPEEVSVVIEGLLSSLSDHMTGINLLHDGGFTRAY